MRWSYSVLLLHQCRFLFDTVYTFRCWRWRQLLFWNVFVICYRIRGVVMYQQAVAFWVSKMCSARQTAQVFWRDVFNSAAASMQPTRWLYHTHWLANRQQNLLCFFSPATAFDWLIALSFYVPRYVPVDINTSSLVHVLPNHSCTLLMLQT